MNELELPEDEIKNIYVEKFAELNTEADPPDGKEVEVVKAIAKAAQRKLVELFDKRWRSYEENILEGTHRMTFAISDEEWQELRKGVGL